jgi:hypothetical protein
MPLMAATGTRVDRIRPERLNISTAPDRSWLSVSVSEPSWLLGNTLISTRPEVASFTRAAAAVERTCTGWLVAVLWANL